MMTRKYGRQPRQLPPLRTAPEISSIVGNCWCSCCILRLISCSLSTSNVRNCTSTMESDTGSSSSHSIIWFCTQLLGRGGDLIVFDADARRRTSFMRSEFLGGRSEFFEKVDHGFCSRGKEAGSLSCSRPIDNTCRVQDQLTTHTILFYHYQNQHRLFCIHCSYALSRILAVLKFLLLSQHHKDYNHQHECPLHQVVHEHLVVWHCCSLLQWCCTMTRMNELRRLTYQDARKWSACETWITKLG